MEKNVFTFLVWTVTTVSFLWASNVMAVDGQILYVLNCSACHGLDGQGGAEGKVLHASAHKIREAIDHKREMDNLRGLGDAEIQAIADFLASDSEGGDDDSHDDGNAMTVDGQLLDGQLLYEVNCSACHGPGGQCGAEGSVHHADAHKITKAIEHKWQMSRLRGLLGDAEIQAIADFLASVSSASKGGEDEVKGGKDETDPNSSIFVNLIALHDTSAPSPPFNGNCVGCHGKKESGKALDDRKDAHAEMVRKSPGCTTNEKCVWCHEYIELESSIQSGYQSIPRTANLRIPYDAEKCVWCHGIGTRKEFYAD
jgi:mono/diheme cytochrome c family protein